MSIKSDRWIRRMAREHRMIEPFADAQVREGVISYGVSSYGYDMRIADEFKIFTNINSTIVDPKNFDPRSFVDFQGEVCVIPPNSFALARSVEYFRIPRSVITVCLGKCLAGDTDLVDASTGRLRPIADMVDTAGSTASLYGGVIKKVDATGGTRQGLAPVYQIRTRNGRRVTATRNHPFLSFGGWRDLASLRVGDRIAVPRRIHVFGHREMRACEVDLLGLLISDGQCATPGSSPRYTSGDPVLREVFSRAVIEFGCVPRPVARMSINATNRGRRGGIMERNRVYSWLESLGLAVHSPAKFVPPVVFELRRELLARFLRALFSGDGGISISGNSIMLEFSTTSERLARDVHHLLLRFGIVAGLRWRETASGRGAYCLCVTSKEQIVRFARDIGFIPGCRKQGVLEESLDRIRSFPQQKSNFDTLPPEAWALAKQACLIQGRSLASLGVASYPHTSLSRSVARDIANRLSDERLGAVADSDVLWDTVREKRYVGLRPVFDLTLPDTANFIANDVVVHNSTYARCGIIVNVTPFEPEWEGLVTLEVSNTTPLPAKIYANEGIAQVLFFESDEVCETSYADKKGKYQAQKVLTLPKL